MYIKFFNWIQTYNYIEFKHFWKYNIICVLLVNATMYLNSIEEPNVPKWTLPKFYPKWNW